MLPRIPIIIYELPSMRYITTIPYLLLYRYLTITYPLYVPQLFLVTPQAPRHHQLHLHHLLILPQLPALTSAFASFLLRNLFLTMSTLFYVFISLRFLICGCQATDYVGFRFHLD